MSDDVKRITREMTNELKRRGVDITPTLRREIAACASDQAMVETARQMLHDGQPVDFDQYVKLRSAAEESRIALLGESASAGPSKIEVELIPAPAQYRALQEKIDVLTAQLAAYQSGQNAPAGAPSVSPSVASTDSPTASPVPSNVVPQETLEQRRARGLASAPTVSAPLEQRYSAILGRDPDNPRNVQSPYERFDFPRGNSW